MIGDAIESIKTWKFSGSSATKFYIDSRRNHLIFGWRRFMVKADLCPPCKKGLYVMDNLSHFLSRNNAQMGPMDSSMIKSEILSQIKVPHINDGKRPHFSTFLHPPLIWHYQSSTRRFGVDELSYAVHGEEADEGRETDNEDVDQVLLHRLLLHQLLRSARPRSSCLWYVSPPMT